MTAVLVIEPGATEDELSPLQIEALADERGVARRQERTNAIRAALDAFLAQPARDLHRAILRGREPRHGVHGRLELDGAVLDSEPAPGVACAGQVDHHARKHYAVVFAGQAIARIIPPVEGEDGEDVTGKSLAARPALPFQPAPDDSIRVEEDGRIVALIAGVVRRTSGGVRVVPQLDVPGDVDFSTGNIDFPGSVSVQKGVRDQFHVTVGEDLHVAGLIEACAVLVGRDAHLARGMASRDQGSLTVGHDLHAKYLGDTRVSVGRDAHVTSEITNCRVRVGRRLVAPEATVVRGELRLVGGGDVGQVGSEAGVHTDLIVGHLEDLEHKARELAELAPKVRERAAQLAEEIRLIESNTARVTPHQAEHLTECQFALAKERGSLAKIPAAMGRIQLLIAQHAAPELTVRKLVCRGTRLWIGLWLAKFDRDLHGPIRIHLDEAARPAYTHLLTGHAALLSTVATTTRDTRFPDVPALARSLAA